MQGASPINQGLRDRVHCVKVSSALSELAVLADRADLPAQGSAKEVPKLFNPAEEYNDKSVLLVTLAQKTITLTAKEVTGMPWPQFVRLMKVRSNIKAPAWLTRQQ